MSGSSPSGTPAFRRDLNICTSWSLPSWSTGPQGDEQATLEAACAAGYEGVQGANPRRCRDLGLVPTTFAIQPTPGGLAEQAQGWVDSGFECCTILLGTGLEDDAAAEEDDKAKAKKEVKEGKIRLNFKVPQTGKLFEGNTVLTEEDKRQSRVLFEAAVRQVAVKVAGKLQETYQARYVRKAKLQERRLAKQMDQYLTFVVENWVKANKVAMRGQINNRLSESLLKGIKNLFLEHYVDIPASRVNVVAALTKNVKSLQSKVRLAEATAVKQDKEMRTAVARERLSLIKEHKARLIAEAAGSMVAAERGTFSKRAATVRFTNTKSFKKDLVALREQYLVARKSAGRPIDLPVATPLFEEKKKSAFKTTQTNVDLYTAALDKLSGSGQS